jgi:hypothetical protein
VAPDSATQMVEMHFHYSRPNLGQYSWRRWRECPGLLVE